MKIGFVLSRAYPRIQANVIQAVQMCHAFQTVGHEVTLFIPRSTKYATDEEAYKAAETMFGDPPNFRVIFVRRFRVFGRFEVLGTVLGTLRAIKENPVDLVYTLNPWSVPFMHRVRIPFIFEGHESNVHQRNPWLGLLINKMIVRATRKPALVRMVTISKALKEVWKGYGVPPEKLVDAHDAVDSEMFKVEKSKEEARRELHLPQDQKISVYTGSLAKDRGINFIVDAAKRMPELYFCIVGGEAKDVQFWKKHVQESGLTNVLIAGSVPHQQIPIWLVAADILLMMWTWQVSTIKVCSPMKLFEYMAAKRHIVGPGFPTVLEILEDEKDAILFEPDNLEAMISALQQAHIKLDDSTMPEAAYDKVSADYTWTARCRRIMDSLPPSLHT